MSSQWDSSWSPNEITLSDPSVPRAWKLCVLQKVILSDESKNFNGLKGRIAAIFIIFITSLLATLVPVLARKSPWFKIPEVIYVTAKNFGTGVIIATAIIHLIDPAMVSMSRNSCVGASHPWAGFRWCVTFMLIGAIITFIVDVYCQFFNELWNGPGNIHSHGEELFQRRTETDLAPIVETDKDSSTSVDTNKEKASIDQELSNFEFGAEFSRFLILEVGVVVHSVFIGLSLGSSTEWVTLFIVIIFHQAFEGLGIGARMSMIPFPKGKRWWPYILSFAYSITTPVSIAFGILARNSYRDNGFSQMTVQGICDAFSCGIMIYTGFVELLAREFVFVDHSQRTLKEQNWQLLSMCLGAGLMSVVGKWA